MPGLYAMFGKATERIRREKWGRLFAVKPDGTPTTFRHEGTDTGVQEAISELNAGLNSLDPIDLPEPLNLNYSGTDMAVRINAASGKGIQVTGPDGDSSTFNVKNGATGMFRTLDDGNGNYDAVYVKDNPDDPTCKKDIWARIQTIIVTNGWVTGRTKPKNNPPLSTNPELVKTIDLRDFCDCPPESGVKPCSDCCTCQCLTNPKDKIPNRLWMTLLLSRNCDNMWQGTWTPNGGYYKFPIVWNRDIEQWQGIGPSGCVWGMSCKLVDTGGGTDSGLVLTVRPATGFESYPQNLTIFTCKPFFAYNSPGDLINLQIAAGVCGCRSAGGFSTLVVRDNDDTPTIDNLFPYL